MRIKVDKLPESCCECVFMLSGGNYDSWKNDDYCVAQQDWLFGNHYRTRNKHCPLEVCDMSCQPIGYLDTSEIYDIRRMPFIGKMWKTVKEIE